MQLDVLQTQTGQDGLGAQPQSETGQINWDKASFLHSDFLWTKLPVFVPETQTTAMIAKRSECTASWRHAGTDRLTLPRRLQPNKFNVLNLVNYFGDFIETSEHSPTFMFPFLFLRGFNEVRGNEWRVYQTLFIISKIHFKLFVFIENMHGIISYRVRQRSLKKKQLLDCIMDNDEHDGAALIAKLPATSPFQPPVI